MPELAFLRVGRGHRCRFDAGQIAIVRDWFERCPRGVLGSPSKWPAGAEVPASTKRAASCERA